jgi:hypothetical protein
MRFSEFSLHFFTALLLLFFVSRENRKNEKTRKKKRKRKRKRKRKKKNSTKSKSNSRRYRSSVIIHFFSLRQGIRYYFLSFVQYVLVLAPRKDKMKRTSNFDDTSNWPRLHDLFNLSVLPIICASNFLYLVLREDFYLWAQFSIFTVYLMADSIWVLFRPLSVASPSTILIHHTVCLIGWTIQHISDPSLSQWTSLGLLAEINAIFLIGRRYWGRTRVIQTFFYSTWIFFAIDDVSFRTLPVRLQVLRLHNHGIKWELSQYWPTGFTGNGFPKCSQYEVVLGFILQEEYGRPSWSVNDIRGCV